MISSAQRELEILDHEQEIGRLEDVGQGQAAPNINRAESYLSPICRLPPEIMGEIFMLYQELHCHKKDVHYREPIISHKLMTALRLSSVSSLWRNISLSTPYLWSRFNICLTPDIEPVHTRELLELYISRSKQLPLCFQLYIDIEDVIVNEEHMRILRLLTEECHRWGHVIWNPYFVPHEGMRSFLNTKRLLPILQALDLREHESEDWDPMDSMFAGATSLRELTMQIRDPTQTKLQLGQIRHLRITRMSIPVGIIPFFGELSISCPILQSLYLEVDDVPVGAQDGTHEISFFMLECLEFKTMTWYELD